QFRRRDLRPALLSALGLGRRLLTVRSASAAGADVALVVEVAAAGRTSNADQGELSAICLSTDGGASFVVAHRQALPQGIDWVDVSV
ncbi:MAG: hypothetical protein GXP62_17960, partial [Oligoflexia bacterium]|nr:hypothetical protein [Oligoflexia bacterium]